MSYLSLRSLWFWTSSIEWSQENLPMSSCDWLLHTVHFGLKACFVGVWSSALCELRQNNQRKLTNGTAGLSHMPCACNIIYPISWNLLDTWKDRSNKLNTSFPFVQSLQIIRTNGKMMFPFVHILHWLHRTWCRHWTNGKNFLPFVQDLKLTKNLDFPSACKHFPQFSHLTEDRLTGLPPRRRQAPRCGFLHRYQGKN